MRSITKRLYRDLFTGELIDADSVYDLIPIPEPEMPREAYTYPVPPPPGGAKAIRDRQNDTLRYLFGDEAAPAAAPKPRRDLRPLAAVLLPALVVIVAHLLGRF